ncbi:MAG: ATP-dependent sacrificial sulfur transferase LarE [Planctomycetaceae bacterium]|jgi:uncharacterized protein
MDTAQLDETATLAKRLVDLLSELRSVAVAWSGGVDSAVVAKAAVLALDDRAVALTAVSPSLAESERRIAEQEARAIGIRQIEISTQEFGRNEYRRNAGDRCFFCKDTLYELMSAHMQELGADVMVNGANTDDLGDHRPGMTAARQHSVRSPLIELGIDKAGVRLLAHHWKLSVADKPASPCLSSRIAYGVEVTEDRVRRVELAEACVRELTNCREFRVRCEFGDLARIEVPVSELPQLVHEETRTQLVNRLLALGFSNVTLDLQGFRSGSLNATLVPLAWSDRPH